MKNKKRKRSFWTLDRRGDGGFTLVELIVVIAILAVLAGVGTAGYSGYIKSSNKKADIALVGDVIRAIETGTYSFAFNMEDKLQASTKGVQIPVGFVLLSEDGAEVLESGTEVGETSTSECVKSSSKIKLYTVKYEEATTGLFGHDARYVLNSEEYYYCTTHSESPQSITVSQLKERLSFDMDGDGTNEVSTKILDAGNWYREISGNIYVKGDFTCQECGDNASSGLNHYTGKTFESIQTYGSFVRADNGPITQMLQAAFGGESTALKYTGWSATSAVPSLYLGATEMWSKVETLGNQLVSLDWVNNITEVTSQSYTSAEQVVAAIADKLTTKYTKEEFYSWWKQADDSTDNKAGSGYFYDTFGFGLDSDGREYYCGVRTVYNESFAAYVESTTPPTKTHTASTCALNIRNFGESFFGQNMPKLVCRSALKAYGEDDGSGQIACEACLELYEQYVASGTSQANAYVIYDTMVTIDETATEASGTALGFFDYYNAYLQEFSSLYGELQTLTAGKETAIIIAVYYNNGVVECDVLPVEANPRND